VQNAASFSIEAMIPREIGADPARISTRLTRVARQLHAVAQAFAAAGGRRGCPACRPFSAPRWMEADLGRNRRPMAGYHGGISAAHSARRAATSRHGRGSSGTISSRSRTWPAAKPPPRPRTARALDSRNSV